MNVDIPYINPIRFQSTDVVIDYNDVMPWQDNERLGEQYQRGIIPKDYWPDFIVDNEFSFLAKIINDGISGAAYLFKDGVLLANMTRTALSINGDSYEIYKRTITSSGIYQIRLDIRTSTGYNYYWSDAFKVRESEKDLVKINYFDYDNRYGGYWFSDANTQVWNPIACYTGISQPTTPEDDVTTFNGQSGNVINLQNQPQRVRIVNLTEIDVNYVDIIYQQLICGYVSVNGVRSTFVTGSFKDDKTDKSNIVNITFNLIMRDNDYNLKFS